MPAVMVILPVVTGVLPSLGAYFVPPSGRMGFRGCESYCD